MSVPEHLLNPEYCCDHWDDCTCEHCHFDHGHDWRSWAIYPPCWHCEEEMLEHWAQEVRETAA